MVATLWTPLEGGVRASIYSPGGPIVAAFCNLEASEPIPDSGQIFLDNFTDTSGTLLSAHVQDRPNQIYGEPAWQSFLELELLDGSLVNSEAGGTARTAFFAIPELLSPEQVVLSVTFGAFSEEDSTATVSLSNPLNVMLLTFASVGGVLTVTAEVSGYDNVLFAPVQLEYCAWNNIQFMADGAAEPERFRVVINDGTTSDVILDAPGGVIDFWSGSYTVTAGLDNVEANGTRIADIEVRYSQAS